MISVIIPTCNRVQLLSKCLDLLVNENQGVDCFEVIVTDDSTNNLTRTLLESRYKWVSWVKGPGKGPAANRNNGAIYAVGKWLLFIDDDCLPTANLIKNYQAAFANHPNDIVFEGAIFPDDWNLLEKDMAECPVNTLGNCFWSANVCIETSLFQAVNGFDESYLIAAQEDQQLKIDIERFTDQKVKFLIDCAVIHPVRFTNLTQKIKNIPILSRNFSIYAVKNKRILQYESMAQLLIQQYSFHFKNLYVFIKSAKFKSGLVSVMWLIYGIPLNIKNVYLLNRTNQQ